MLVVKFLSGGEHPFPCLSQIAWLPTLPGSWPLPFSKADGVFLLYHSSDTESFASASTLKDLCDYTASTQIIQDSLLVRSDD